MENYIEISGKIGPGLGLISCQEGTTFGSNLGVCPQPFGTSPIQARLTRYDHSWTSVSGMQAGTAAHYRKVHLGKELSILTF